MLMYIPIVGGFLPEINVFVFVYRDYLRIIIINETELFCA